MPMRSTSVANAGEVHPNPFVGQVEHRVSIRIDVSGLTSREVDQYGFLKPGVLFRKNGTLAGAPGREQEVVIAGGAAGNHTVTGIVAADRLLEVTYFAGAGTDVTDIADVTSQY